MDQMHASSIPGAYLHNPNTAHSPRIAPKKAFPKARETTDIVASV